MSHLPKIADIISPAELERWKTKMSDELDELMKLTKEEIVDRYVVSHRDYIKILNRFLGLKHSIEDNIGEEINLTSPTTPFTGVGIPDIKEMKRGLAEGRTLGIQERKHKAKKSRQQISKAIDDLFKNGEGWRMEYEDIANFLIERGISSYTHSTTIGKVKKIAPAIKRKYKSGQ